MAKNSKTDRHAAKVDQDYATQVRFWLFRTQTRNTPIKKVTGLINNNLHYVHNICLRRKTLHQRKGMNTKTQQRVGRSAGKLYCRGVNGKLSTHRTRQPQETIQEFVHGNRRNYPHNSNEQRGLPLRGRYDQMLMSTPPSPSGTATHGPADEHPRSALGSTAPCRQVPCQ